jgi:hypothetical protein
MRRGVRSLIVAALLAVLAPACATTETDAPSCTVRSDPWILLAQSVPTATYLPCIRHLPTGWMVSGSRIERGSYTAWLDSDRAGVHAVSITLAPACDVSQSHEVSTPDAPPGIRTFEHPISPAPSFAADRFLTFDGGCIEYAFRFSTPAPATTALEVEQALGVRPREDVRTVLARLGLTLCGAGAPPCVG